MSGRPLDEALEAGRAINQGIPLPTQFTGVHVIKRITFEETLGRVYRLQYNKAGTLLAVGYTTGAIHVYSAEKAEFVAELRKPRFSGDAIMCIGFHPNKPNIFFASDTDGKLYQCNTDDNSCEEYLHERGNQINTFDFNCEGYYLATGGSDHNVRIYTTSNKREEFVYKGYDIRVDSTDDTKAGSTSRIFALKFHPNRTDSFLTAGWDINVKVWDVKSGVQRTIFGPKVHGDGLDMRLLPNSMQGAGGEILTASYRNNDSLQIWDYTSGQLKKTVEFPFEGNSGAYLYAARFCDNDVVVAGGSGTKSAKAIHIPTGKVLGEVPFKHAVTTVAVANGGRQLALGCEGNELVFAALV